MWVCLNNGFVSIVEHKDNPDYVVVRARDEKSIPNIFGTLVFVQETPGHDYRYRVVLSKEYVSKVIAEKAMEIDYTNFKNSVEDDNLAAAYLDFWYTMYLYQHQQPRIRQSYSYYIPPTSTRLENVEWSKSPPWKEDNNEPVN